MAWLQTYISGTLQDWAHRLELEIDYTKIDEDLEDYPVCLHLGPESGYNKVDTTNPINLLKDFPGKHISGLIAEYTMDSYAGTRVYDTSGNGNHGTLNSFMYIIDEGYVNNCTRALTYTSPRSMTFDLPITYGTMSFWLKRGTLTAIASQITKNTSDTHVVAIQPYPGSGLLYTYQSPTAYYTDLAITDTDWHHIVMVQETSSTVRFYLDGVAASSTVPWDDSMTRIGRTIASSSQDACSLCQIRFYDRMLTVQEIQDLGAEHPYRHKIAVATVSGTEHVETYCEIESWSDSDAWIWAKIPEISSTSSTKVYLYYDKRASDNTTYIGDIGSSVARNVWSSYNTVWHLGPKGTPSYIWDSGPLSKDGSSTNIYQGHFTLDDFGPAIEFKSSNSYLTIPDSTAVDFSTNYTVEVFFNTNSSEQVNELICKTNNDVSGFQVRGDNGSLSFNTGTGTAGFYPWVHGEWCYFAGVCGTSTASMYIDGVFYDSSATTGTPLNSQPFYIGRRWDSYYFDGLISEVRTAKVTKSAAWIKATNYALRDELIKFEVFPYKVSGYVLEQGEPVQRRLHLYQDSTGILMDSTTSAASGYYELFTPFYESHYIVCKDDDLDLNYNHLIIRDVQLESV
jgi:hypothetical protein